MKNTTLEMNTNLIPFFTGTYENIWEVRETNDNGDELYVEYDHREFMQSIVKAYQNQEDYILRELQQYCSFIKGIKILDTFYSPREYNFSTDTIDFQLTVDKAEMITVVESLRNDEKFSTFLYDNYTSRDGFWSHTPNTIEKLLDQIITEGDEYEQAIAALVQYLALQQKDSDFENYDSIEYHVYEDWSGNSYEGLNYETQCGYCYTPVDYDHEFECQNEACEQYKKVEPEIEGQQKLL